MTSPGASLRARACSKHYAGGAGITGVGLTMDPGELVAVLGPNGSGKSTLVHGLVGLHTFDHGDVTLGGLPHTAPAAKRGLGFVPDELPIPLSLTGNEYLRHLERLRGTTRSALHDAMVDALELTPHLQKFIADMSHGTKKKLQIVGAAAHAPSMLIMDEPFRGLDPYAVRTIRALVDALRAEGTGVLVATHDILAAEHWFERVIIMHHGVTVADGAPSALVQSSGAADLEEFFLKVTGLPTATARTEQFRTLICTERTPTS